MTVLLVGVGGFVGAATRYIVDGWIYRLTGSTFPFGTLVINVTGSFALGIFFALALERGALPDAIRAPVMVGVIGGYTTFSTWMLDSWRLADSGAFVLAALNIVVSVVLGVGALIAGLTVGRLAG